jgi:hypothetical protein
MVISPSVKPALRRKFQMNPILATHDSTLSQMAKSNHVSDAFGRAINLQELIRPNSSASSASGPLLHWSETVSG